MKKLFKRVSILFAALMALSVSTVRTVEEVKAADTTVATFEFGANGTASHSDGSSNALTAPITYTDGDYTLNFTNMSSVYGSARDAKGNSCLKVGTSKATGTFSFIVPEDITSVYIYAAQYKSNTSKVSINGTTYTLSGASDNGVYDELSVDTSSSKTVTFATITGGVRCMVNTIKFNVSSGGDVELTPAQIIEQGLNNVKKSIKTFYGVSTDVELPATNEDGVNFTYTLSDHNESSFAIDEDGIFTTNPKAVLESAKLTITAELEGETKTEEVTIHSASTTSVLPLSEAVKVAQYFGTSYSNDKFYIEVDIVEVYNAQYGNLYVKDDTVTSNFTVYGTYSADGKTRYDAMETKPIAGDTVKLYGVLGMYNTTVQMQDAWIVGHTINRTNEELIAMEETSFSLSFDYDITFEQKLENSYEEKKSTLNFATTDQRVSQTTSKQVWSNDGITLTNDKSSSNTNVANYSNPVRFYASSKITITMDEGYNISKIEFIADSSSYATTLKNSIGAAATASGSKVTYVPTTESSSLVIEKLTEQVRLDSLEVFYKVPKSGMVDVVTDSAFANVGLTFGAKVNASLFEGYEKVSGGVMIDNAAKYTETTIAEAYAAGKFAGITTAREELDIIDGNYSVGSTIEVIDGLVNKENEEYLSYEFVAAVYFTLEDAEGNKTTVVLEQKAYSVSSMVDYYLANSSGLGLTDEAVKVVEAFDAFIG